MINATGGARLGNFLNATLKINENDDPIYFLGEKTKDSPKQKSWKPVALNPPTFLSSEPVVVRIPEGSVANFTIRRAGQADFVATVMYRVEYGGASPGDLAILTNDTLLVFGEGEWTKNISVAVEDDNIPETDEPFYIVLYNATGECRIA